MPDSRPDSRARILHLITKLPIGGAQDNTLMSVHGADRAIFQVDVASSPGGAWESRARRVADALHLIPSLRRDMAPAADLRAIIDIVRLLRRNRYHILHTHSSKAGILGRIAGRLARVPVVVHTVHGFAFNDLSFTSATRHMYLWLERIGARLSDQLVLVSELNRQEALARRIVSAEKATVIYSGIDLHRFARLPDPAVTRARLNIPANHAVVGNVGRMATCNAPLLFIEAAHRLLRHYPDTTILLLGDDPKLRPDVEAAAQGDPRIRLLGYRDDVPAVLAAMDVFTSSNLWGGLGRALTEALAAGLPAVAFPVNGVPELIEDGVTGLHATTGSASALADQTIRLLDSPPLAARLGAAGRRRVWAHFSAEQMVADLDALYRRLLATHGVILPPAVAHVSPL